jgi:hypothetical protein
MSAAKKQTRRPIWRWCIGANAFRLCNGDEVASPPLADRNDKVAMMRLLFYLFVP